MEYKQTEQELIEQWDEQIKFIERSSGYYDKGEYSEAKRIAVSLRILFHHTSKSQSLFNQRGFDEQLLFWSSASLFTPSNMATSWTLLTLSVSGAELLFFPKLSEKEGRTFYLTFNDWWNEIILDDKQNFSSRKDIISFVANQDGGAHVDPEFNMKYANLVKNNSLAITLLTNDEISMPQNNPVYASIRQIAHELLTSVKLINMKATRKSHENRSFEMRFVDDNRRFKWSTTDITVSSETLEIVDRYSIKPREYYVERLKNGSVREVITQS